MFFAIGGGCFVEEYKCPICDSAADTLDQVPDSWGFGCPEHGSFFVGGTAYATKRGVGKEAWEAALKTAKARAAAGEWPRLTTHDFP